MAKHQTQFVDVALLAGARRKMRSHSSRICCIFAASTTAERQRRSAASIGLLGENCNEDVGRHFA